MINQDDEILVRCRYNGITCIGFVNCVKLFKQNNIFNCNRFFVSWTTLIINRDHLIEIPDKD